MNIRFSLKTVLKLRLISFFLCNMAVGSAGALAQTSVTVGPNSLTLPTASSFQFFAVVSGTDNKAVVWSVNGVNGGEATVGTISAS